MKKCFVYCRKSSEDQCRQVQSIRDQKNVMRDLAHQRNLIVKKVFIDEKSAGKPYQRPAFQEMMEQITKEEATIIITWKIDRLSRNPVENGQVS
jgi:DNA invertase Pin-like site-specific DNA recombinase